MGAKHELPQYHVLNFFHDNDDACALTALVHHVRYHVIADPSRLTDRSEEGKRIAREYRSLLREVKEKEEQEADEVEEQESQSRSSDRFSQETHDSGIDVTAPQTDGKPPSSPSDTQDPRTRLHNWMLSPLIPTFSSHPEDDSPPRDRTVQRWYYSETNFYNLATTSSSLVAEPEDPSPSLSERIRRLLPSLPLPKYILSLGIPMIPASDLVIRAESVDPDPIHPALVREKSSGREYFLKVVDPTQPGPTKREIRVMKEIEKKGLHEEIRVPLVKGLVYFDEREGEGDGRGGKGKGGSNAGKKAIMGFLMDIIEDPTPLTCMLDSEVEQEKREGWAAEAERMVKVLHDNGIVWGDAKGDNFMVDKQDRLWIIDFGGSYTPGWIDPELKETEEGDEQGVTRLVNGLLDPEEGTVGDEEEEGEDDASESKGDEEDEKAKQAGAKRKADEADLDEEASSGLKQRRVGGDESEEEMCVCGGPESGQMIACDGKDCEVEWFHMSCVELDEVPEGKWYCNSCKSG